MALRKTIFVSIWILSILILLSIFIGGFSAAARNNEMEGVNENCLLFAAQPIVSGNQTFTQKYGRSILFPGDSACQNAVIHGIVGITLHVIISAMVVAYIFSIRSNLLVQVISHLSMFSTLFLAIIVGIANIGLFQTCANSTLCYENDSNGQPNPEFEKNYRLVVVSLVCGWISAFSFWLLSSFSCYYLGLLSCQSEPVIVKDDEPLQTST